MFDYFALIHDENQIGIADGGKPVGDHKTGPALQDAFHLFLDQSVHSSIYATCRFVKY